MKLKEEAERLADQIFESFAPEIPTKSMSEVVYKNSAKITLRNIILQSFERVSREGYFNGFFGHGVHTLWEEGVLKYWKSITNK